MSTKRPPAMAGEGKTGMVLSVVSAGGGAGKSTVSMAVAQCCRKKGLSVLLLDGDCQFGDMARMAKEARVLSLGALQAPADESIAEEGSALTSPPPMLWSTPSIGFRFCRSWRGGRWRNTTSWW